MSITDNLRRQLLIPMRKIFISPRLIRNMRLTLGQVSPSPGTDSERLRVWKNWVERLGGLLQRGFTPVLAEANNVDAKTGDLEPREFLDSNVTGESTLTFHGDFNWDPPEEENAVVTITDLTLRFERKNDGKIGLVEIVSKDDSARALFNRAIGQYCKPGCAFLEMRPLQCKVFLRAVFGQVVLDKTYHQ